MNAIYDVLEITDLKDMLNKTRETYKNNVAYKLKTETKGQYQTITHGQIREMVDYLGTSLMNLGLSGKRIAVISENRYEWGVCYLAAACGTGVVVPLDKLLPGSEIEELLKRSEAECIFYSSHYDEAMEEIRQKNQTNVKYFISMDRKENTEKIYSFQKLVEEGKQLLENGDKSFLEAEINREEMGFMLFTSGTTSTSKAVMLSHKNIVSDLMSIAGVIKIDENDVFMSFLPLHHTFECTVGFLYALYRGCTTVYCDGVKYIAENMKEHGVTLMISVPLLFENMYKKVMKAIEKKGKLETVKKAKKISNLLLKVGIDVRKKLFKDIHETLGGKVRLFVSGGAGIDPQIVIGFNELGFRMYQGYGLTETAPVVAAENDKTVKYGSIGKTVPNVEIKVMEPDEAGVRRTCNERTKHHASDTMEMKKQAKKS